MATRVIISLCNALSFVDVDPQEIATYISRHMDDYLHRETLNQWQSGEYKQPWLIDDTIHLQLQSNGGIPAVRVIRCNQSTALSFNMTQGPMNTYEPDYFIYESSTSLSSLAEGTYFFLITVGNRVLISEPIDVAEEHDNSLLIEYTHRKYYQNIIFETGFAPNIRAKGLLTLKPPASKDTVYEDQVLDMVMIQSKPYRLWDFRVMAVAPFMIDKLNRVLGCSEVLIDGKAYTKNEGSKWEEVENIGNGTTKEYSIELRESVNKNSKVWDSDDEDLINAVLNVDSKGFSGIESGGLLTVVNVD